MELEEKKIKSQKKISKRDFFIVGIGASAGGLEALKLFFDNTPMFSGIAFIVVQHLDPIHKSLLSELLANHTKMQVFEITDGMNVEANCVYVIPPNKSLEIINGTLMLFKQSESQSTNIDSFLTSLAIEKKSKAIGIILSGTGKDGTIGLQEIKKQKGLTLVQDPKTAIFAQMPQNAIDAKIPDFISSPENMPKIILNKINKGIVDLNNHIVAPNENQLNKIFLLIRNKSGYDFSNYKSNTIIRRIVKRIAFDKIENVDDYIALLQKNPHEIEKLYNDFFIGVTSFFRDKEVFNSIQNKVVPYLLDKCKEKQEIRIWICGCSTGEEAYSIAILLREELDKTNQFIKVTIFASDIDKDSIDIARKGIYSDKNVANISEDRLSKFFILKDKKYQVKKEIREMILFAHHNVIKDPPFSKMDMISCRNLLIYMNSELQNRIIPIFHYGLNNNGILLLGTSESIGEYTEYFTNFDSRMKIYKKKEDAKIQKRKIEYEFSKIAIEPELQSQEPQLMSKNINVSNLSSKILLENYAPPSVIIDDQNNALYFSGNTGQFLGPASGKASLNVIEMAKRGLKSELEKAIKQVRSSKKEIKIKNIDVKVHSHFQSINLIVKPILTKDVDLGTLMIIFEAQEKPQEIVSKKSELDSNKEKMKLSEIERELKITQEHLLSAISELDISNEEFQTTNEEYNSTNEELQSTNEELETSREELQSVNEELITVNTELSNKIDLLSEANDDLNNLLSSIEVATIFLDRDLNVKRFTPASTKIFNLIPTDIDRPLTDLTSNLIYTKLEEDVQSVLKTLAIKFSDVKTLNGSWYEMKILPYRTTENIIEGVLVTFIDISKQKNTEEKLENTNEHLNLIIENILAVPYTCIYNPEFQISFVGKSCEKITGFLPQQFTENFSFWTDRIHPSDKKKINNAFLEIKDKKSLDLPFRWKCANGKYKNFMNFIKFVEAGSGEKEYIVGVWKEMKEIKEISKKKKDE